MEESNSREQTFISEESDEEFRGFNELSRPKMKLKKPKHLDNFELYVTYCLASECDPQTYQEAIRESEEWRDAIQKELDAHKNKSDGTEKARLVAKGFRRETNDLTVWLVLWVDDILLLGQKSKVEELVELLKGEFNAKDMENIQCFVRTEIELVDSKIELSQHQLIEKILKKFNLQVCKACLVPLEDKMEVDDAVFCARCPIQRTGRHRPDITFATSYLSRFLDFPMRTLWNVAKRVLRYVKGTIDKNLVYEKHPEECARVVVYAGAD
ncbi:hypothetical protein PR048_009190 [Dryococelus australis]|uniref:Reverse transcriptase Ty1/copia-type domain-containing protein n=1 Tax=Dryococelus australis TaxID=614101 RepID=A0ABQ9I036_9NEOP|nr:hypothetical protein PR048_009190 [Dryococelus australis]